MTDLFTTIATASNPRYALSALLRLSIVAPDDGGATLALVAAEKVTKQMSPHIVREVQYEIEQDGDSDADQFVRGAIQRLVDSEPDDTKRAQFHRIAKAFDA